MSGPDHHEFSQEPEFTSSANALNSLPSLPEGELRFYDRYGDPIVHTRSLIAIPSGDEVYTDKPAVVWKEEMQSAYMLDQTEAKVFDRTALFEALKHKNQGE